MSNYNYTDDEIQVTRNTAHTANILNELADGKLLCPWCDDIVPADSNPGECPLCGHNPNDYDGYLNLDMWLDENVEGKKYVINENGDVLHVVLKKLCSMNITIDTVNARVRYTSPYIKAEYPLEWKTCDAIGQWANSGISFGRC